jgi:hypothetical protein
MVHGNIHQICHNPVLEPEDMLFMEVHFMVMETTIYHQQTYIINLFSFYIFKKYQYIVIVNMKLNFLKKIKNSKKSIIIINIILILILILLLINQRNIDNFSNYVSSIAGSFNPENNNFNIDRMGPGDGSGSGPPKDLSNYVPPPTNIPENNRIIYTTTTRPITTQPSTTQPSTTRPITTQPSTTRPSTTQPLESVDENVVSENDAKNKIDLGEFYGHANVFSPHTEIKRNK